MRLAKSASGWSHAGGERQNGTIERGVVSVGSRGLVPLAILMGKVHWEFHT